MKSRLWRSNLLFPVALFLILLLLTAFKVSGSSVGVWHQMLYGKGTSDSSLIAGQPRDIRSDEWESATPMTIAQSKNNFERFNKNIGQGQDMSLLDVPYKDWSTAFKPQNWTFFVLPLEYAFAFKWWLIGFLLVVSCYYLFLELLPKQRALAALFSLGVLFSPFVQWWYQPGTLLVMAYGLAALAICLRILGRKHSLKGRLILSAFLAYVLTCFAYIPYPPFQVPTVLVITVFVGGYCVNLARLKGWGETARDLRFLVAPLFIAGLLTGLFFATRLDAVHAINNTVYPGDRVIPTGGFEPSRLFSGPIQGQLQNDTRAVNYSYNQSEAAGFIVFPSFLAVLGWLSYKYRRKKVIDWRIVGLIVITSIFALRVFAPGIPFLSKLLYLQSIPHVRLMIGFGLINILILILVIEYLQKNKKKLSPIIIGLAWAATFIAFIWAALAIKHANPAFIGNTALIVAVCFMTSMVVPLILNKKYFLGLVLLLLVSFASTAHVNPLYRGLGQTLYTNLSKKIQSTGNQEDRWTVSEPGTFENFAILNGKKSLSGVYLYPQLKLWRQIGNSKQDEAVYNRFAHVFVTIDPTLNTSTQSGAKFEPPALDAFRVDIDPCGKFANDQSLDYIVTARPDLSATCLVRSDSVTYPKITFYIYKVL